MAGFLSEQRRGPLKAPDRAGSGGTGGQGPNRLQSGDQPQPSAIERLTQAGIIDPTNPKISFLPEHREKISPYGIGATSTFNELVDKMGKSRDARAAILGEFQQELAKSELAVAQMLYEFNLEGMASRPIEETTRELSRLNETTANFISINLAAQLLNNTLGYEGLLTEYFAANNIAPETIEALAEQLVGGLSTAYGLQTILNAQYHPGDVTMIAVEESKTIGVFGKDELTKYQKATEERAEKVTGTHNRAELLAYTAAQFPEEQRVAMMNAQLESIGNVTREEWASLDTGPLRAVKPDVTTQDTQPMNQGDLARQMRTSQDQAQEPRTPPRKPLIRNPLDFNLENE